MSELLEGLNEAQRMGVTHDAGPLIVLAGPGTGKTRVITRRVAHLVTERDVDPSTIVAVTFTNKAADELRERLAVLVGPSTADSIHAHTFHGFGLRLLRRFPDLSGVGSRPEIIDSAQRRRLLRELVRAHDDFGALRALGVDALADEAAAHIEAFRNNAVSPDVAASFVEGWAERLGEGRGSDGLELDGEGLAAQRAHLSRFRAHAAIYGRFEAACRERGWLTIDDLITLPAALLEGDERVRAICRDEYRHFVVDEFQDLNLAQIELLRRLAPPETDPDIVVVGDDDQAIYEFRGADDRAFERFAAIYPGVTTLALTENYRSQQAVLDVANAVITRADARFEPDKRIDRAVTLAEEPAPDGTGVSVVQLDDDAQNAEAVAALVAAEIGRRPDEPLRRIGVIARAHLDLDRIASALELEEIPFERRRVRGVAEDEAVQDLLAWVQLLLDPGASWAVRRVLFRPPIGIDAGELSQWERAFSAAQRAAGVDGEAPHPDYPAWLAEHAGDHEGVRRFLELHRELRDVSRRSTASETIWEIALRADLAHADMLGGRERATRVDNLVRVVRFVRRVQHRLDAPGDLAAFWAYYNDLDDREKSFGSLGEEAVETDSEESGGDADAVQLMTAHGAKGLEFDVVILPRVNPSHGYPKTSGGSGERVELPEGLIDRLGDTRTPKERALSEERRIFYVACTRAERSLTMLTRRTKKRSSSTHFAQELVFDEPDLVSVVDGGVVLAAADPLMREASPGVTRELARRACERERRAARGAAAAALDALERGAPTAEQVGEAADRLRAAAERLAVAATFESTGSAPGWAKGGASAEAASRLAGRLRGDGGEAGGPRLRPMKAPIDISFTLLDQYERCPACCYVRNVLGLPEPPTPALSLGGLAHDALETYGRRWRDAEAEGRERPTVDDLLAVARDAFRTRVRAGDAPAEGALDELLAMLANGHEMMERLGVEILEVENLIKMPYEVGPDPDGSEADEGSTHRLIAKLDRVDRTDEGVRIVDYKTGGASKARLEPSKSDLQLGIYALALAHHMPDAPGDAEYWVLRTGERGRIALADIDEKRIRTKIDKAVRGMLAGEWPRGSNCSGLCAILGAHHA